jgi:hypothetical protein
VEIENVLEKENGGWNWRQWRLTNRNPKKLSALIKGIDQLLAEKHDRLHRLHLPSKPSE